MTHKPKIAILFPSFMGGGAEAVCLWMLEALKGEYDLTLITFSDIDFKALNGSYGTFISEEDVHVMCPVPGGAPRALTNSYSLFSLRHHLLIRYFKNIKQEFDLPISAFNEMDMGDPGIQYIHFPAFGHGHEPARTIGKFPDSRLRRVYRSICRTTLSNFSDDRMKENVTITNSLWTAGIIRQIYGIDARVVYPPVISDFPDTPWEHREEGFVFIGRIVPEKRVDQAIKILQMVRAQGHDVHLHIAAFEGDQRYLEYILQKLQGENTSWVFLEERLSRKDLSEMLAMHKYGIHTRENEMFGIAVAEMVKAGCIPFVPAKGGQAEIVGGHESLTFDDEHEAVEKIVSVLSGGVDQDQLRLFLAERADLFSEDRFMREIYDLVGEFFQAQRHWNDK